MRAFRYNKIVQFLKPPGPSLNVSKENIKRLINQFGLNAKVLDLGCGNRRLADHIINFDIEPAPNVDVGGDGHLLPFKENTLIWLFVRQY